MVAYIVRRLLVLVPLLLGMSFLTFMVFQLAPGDFFAELRANPMVDPAKVAELEAKYHFDRPALIQYAYWLKSLVLERDLGYSLSQKLPVMDVIGGRALNTIYLNIATMFFTWLIALPIGIYCAVHQYSVTDRVFAGLAFVGMSFPGFFLALLLLYLLGATWGMVPIGGLTSDNFYELAFWQKGLDVAHHMVVPVLVLTTGALAGLQRLMRGNMLEVLREQYVTTARAKGLPENRVIYRHAVRNAINPMVTIFGFQLSGLLSGAALVEIICSYPGLGSIMLDAVRRQDLFLVMGGMLISGVLLIIGNLMADIMLGVVDPRISYG